MSHRFTEHFVTEFNRRAEEEGRRISALWHSGGSAWTRLMVGSDSKEGSVLERATKMWAEECLGPQRISLHSWYTIDLMAVTPAFSGIDYWETAPVVLIEHENGRDIETEMWKLAHWIAPLKVLIFYRFGDQAWLENKIEAARRIIEKTLPKDGVNAPEYLLIAGIRDTGNCITWLEYKLPDGDSHRPTPFATDIPI